MARRVSCIGQGRLSSGFVFDRDVEDGIYLGFFSGPTYWTKRRGAEVLDYSYALMDLTVFGRQEDWEDSPVGWPRRGHATRTLGGAPEWPPLSEWPGGRPTSQWPRLDAGYSDDLGAADAGAALPPHHCH